MKKAVGSDQVHCPVVYIHIFLSFLKVYLMFPPPIFIEMTLIILLTYIINKDNVLLLGHLL
jgi:hypothetical protein